MKIEFVDIHGKSYWVMHNFFAARQIVTTFKTEKADHTRRDNPALLKAKKENWIVPRSNFVRF